MCCQLHFAFSAAQEEKEEKTNCTISQPEATARIEGKKGLQWAIIFLLSIHLRRVSDTVCSFHGLFPIGCVILVSALV